MTAARQGIVALLGAAALLAACGADPGQPGNSLANVAPPVRTCPADAEATVPAAGTIVAAYPDEPAAWLPAFHGEATANDLVALWGLPLFSLDQHGQLRPGLVREAIVLGPLPQGWTVRLVLCGGDWSDGAPVVAEDVVATVDALRATAIAPIVAPIVDVRVDGPDVLVAFDHPNGRWQHLLADIATVLPAHILAADGIEAYRDDVPVSGGQYQLSVVEPGLRRTFEANVASPMGAPATAAIEVLLVPRFELALGLLEQGDVDVALGHLALEVAARVAQVEGLVSATPRGGTLLTWRWEPSSTLGDLAARQAIQDTFELQAFADGILKRTGQVTTSFVAGRAGPQPRAAAVLPEGLQELTVAASRWHEVPGLTARAIRDGIERRRGTVRTASEETDALEFEPIGDARIVQRRLGPWPSLAWLAGPGELDEADAAALAAADRARSSAANEVALGQQVLRDLGREVPLVEVGVAHVWGPAIEGLVPSAWPGIGFASAGRWRLT